MGVCRSYIRSRDNNVEPESNGRYAGLDRVQLPTERNYFK
jgi:hypothetical protein